MEKNLKCSETNYLDEGEISRTRKLAQHYLNGLRISAFLIRHGFNRMKVTHIVRKYEDWIYPFIYRNQ